MRTLDRVTVCAVVVVLAGCSGSAPSGRSDSTQSEGRIAESDEPISGKSGLTDHEHGAEPTPISDFVKNLVIDSIKEYPEVADAAITQSDDNRTLSLIVVVPFGTDADTAKQACDNFVRMTKSFSSDDAPGKEIGSGMYHYVVSAYTPDEALVV